MCSHADPIETPVYSVPPRFRTNSANAYDRIKSACANGAHAILATEDSVLIRIKRVGPLINQYAHPTPFLFAARGRSIDPAAIRERTEFPVLASQPHILRHDCQMQLR
jgi:hypothetical protein